MHLLACNYESFLLKLGYSRLEGSPWRRSTRAHAGRAQHARGCCPRRPAGPWTTAGTPCRWHPTQSPRALLQQQHLTLIISSDHQLAAPLSQARQTNSAGEAERPMRWRARTSVRVGVPEVDRLASQQPPGSCRVGQQAHGGRGARRRGRAARDQRVHPLLRQAVMHQLAQLDHLRATMPLSEFPAALWDAGFNKASIVICVWQLVCRTVPALGRLYCVPAIVLAAVWLPQIYTGKDVNEGYMKGQQ